MFTCVKKGKLIGGISQVRGFNIEKAYALHSISFGFIIRVSV